MATLRDYFDTDFKHELAVKPEQLPRVGSNAGDFEIEICPRLHYAFNANAKFISIYVPANPQPINVCFHLLGNLGATLALGDGVHVEMGYVGEDRAKDSELRFAGRVFIYHESELSLEQKATLYNHAAQLGIALQLRGPEYSEKMSTIQKPLAFVSHDWHDKDAVARPLAIQLSTMMCPV